MAHERLDKALHRVARQGDIDGLRLRRWVSFLALCGVLQRAMDEGVIDDYHLKGGAALELRFADRARTTKDMDVGLSGGTRRERFLALERAVALGFDAFTFRVKVPRDLERVDTVRVDVAIAYRGRSFQTIQIDLGPAEERAVDLVAPMVRGVAELGIPVTSPVRCITLDVQVAQKLHACTSPRVLRDENRARDIIDIVLLERLGQVEPKPIQLACVRIFAKRAEQAWPPPITVPETWKVELASLASEQGSPFATGDEIVAAFAGIYESIVRA
ncbi:MAG TPA: nucleotidyl transferase AbiEii/AbiGii toxin family protein [Candidatus Baltobacteraceae bacterium]